ncbi:MAG: hypothetical protein R2771_07325 [Saprospiraceae bacterium]
MNGTMSIYTHVTILNLVKHQVLEMWNIYIIHYHWKLVIMCGLMLIMMVFRDPDESEYPALQVSLYDDNCNKVGTTVTDDNGYYVFNNQNVDLNSDGIMDNLDILKTYYVVIDDSRFANNQLEFDLEDYYLTVLNGGVGRK